MMGWEEPSRFDDAAIPLALKRSRGRRDGRITVFGKVVEMAAFLETAAGRARRSARAAYIQRVSCYVRGARGATRLTSPSILLDRSESQMRQGETPALL